MLRKIEDFQKDWAYEVESTGKILNALTDESLSQKVTEDGRSLGFLGWHLTQTLGEMLGLVGLKICPRIRQRVSHKRVGYCRGLRKSWKISYG